MNNKLSPRERVHLGMVKERDARMSIAEGVMVAPHACWDWVKSRRQGYGRVWHDGSVHSAHVLAWQAFIGEVPDGMQVNHKCHNRACCNPDHLYVGTQVENMRDMQEAGRARYLRGEDGCNSKISADTALAIYRHHGIARDAAERYGVSVSLVYAIKKRQVWRHLHE